MANRNSEQHFSLAPQAQISRSTFDRGHSLKTTFNAGELVPIYWDEVYPGDTVSLDISKLVRMSTSIHPTMDNAYIDTFCFFVPNRLLYEHWEQLNGASGEPWTQQNVYQVPQIVVDLEDYPPQVGSLLDYLGFPINQYTRDNTTVKVSALPLRATLLIWNQYFRDQNLQSEFDVYKGDNDLTVDSSGASGHFPLINGVGAYAAGSCPKVAKFHDRYTSALPGPQKGPDVTLGLDDYDVPIIFDRYGSLNPAGAIDAQTGAPKWRYLDPAKKSLLVPDPDDTNAIQVTATYANSFGNLTNIALDGTDPDYAIAYDPNGTLKGSLENVQITINQLRLAFQTQKLYEADARGGTYYISILKSHFGVTSPDARLQRAEYLGGNRVPINMDQIIQTNSTTSAAASGATMTPLGTMAGWSLTRDRDNSIITKSFVEHGLIMCFACVRTDHTYSQGIEKKWLRKDRLDFYWPVFAHIGEQPILKKELYLDGTDADDEVFGYQEAYSELRYSENRLSGFMRTGVSGSLASWHYGDFYTQTPSLSSAWIQETTANIDRTLAVSSVSTHQFIADFYFNARWTRPMPVYSIPGLIDHF